MRYVYTFGANRNGQLGIGDSMSYCVTPSLVPLPLSDPEDEIADIVSGSYHVLCITTKGLVFGWGQNQFGQLGLETSHPHIVSHPVLLPLGFEVTKAAAGSGHSVFLSVSNDVYVCGSGRQSLQQLRQVLVSGIGGVGRIVAVYASLETSFALTSHGSVYAWGEGVPGMLLSSKPTKLHISSEEPAIVKIAVSRKHCVALTMHNEVYVVGLGDHGELGQGRTTRMAQRWTPLPSHADIVDIAVGTHHTVLVASDGKVGTCGHSGSGRLGHAATEVYTPLTIPDLEGVDIVGVACGAAFTLAWSHNGVLHAWGSNTNGQLGIAPVTKFVGKATAMSSPWSSNLRIVKCVAGESHSVVLLTDGTVDPQPHFLNITYSGNMSFVLPKNENTEVNVVPDEVVNVSFTRSSQQRRQPSTAFATTCSPPPVGPTPSAYMREALWTVLTVTLIGVGSVCYRKLKS
eukprot:PhF_6_TR2216/c0_g1_i1/m.3696